jgi:hypothetical protein
MQQIPSEGTWARHNIYAENCYQWHLEMVDDEITLDGQKESNPVKTSAIFVVHGIGEQEPTETAAVLRSGFDDQKLDVIAQDYIVPPPYIRDGFWGNYTLIDQTFPEEWKRFGPGQREFFARLWKVRTQSPFRVFRWTMGQLLRLVNPCVICDLGLIAWLLYLPYQVMGFTTLVLSLIKAPRLLTGFLGDVRLYLDPQGVTERAIAQRIDKRVADSFMRLIGMDSDFNSLPRPKYYTSSGRTICFDRVVWVAHSLGSVISYNVLSDLFRKAEEIEAEHSKDSTTMTDQYKNVRRFRERLCRFVTIGCPLDKVAYLYNKRSVTRWSGKTRRSCLGKAKEPLWINFYSVLDPVSGALNSKFLFGKTPPVNFHVKSSLLPGYAHVGYWRDSTVLRYVLGQTYGPKILPDKLPKPWPVWLLTLLAFGFHVLTFAVAALVVLLVVWWVGPTVHAWIDRLWAGARTFFEWLF